MDERNRADEIAPRSGYSPTRARAGDARYWKRLRAGFVLLGVSAALLTTKRSAAQDAPGRLTVRPHEMATGAQTTRAGWLPLDASGPDSAIYVPPQCVGAKRCPLVVLFGVMGDWGAWQPPVADKYGMILFVFNNDLETFDNNLKQILRDFAIDPDKIALVGRCYTGPSALFVGGQNLDVFSRVAMVSGAAMLPETQIVSERNKGAMFFLDGDFFSSEEEFGLLPILRRSGLPVKHILAIRDHMQQAEDNETLGHWLNESWTAPVAARPAPPPVADPLPVLTVEMLGQMTAFWTRFMTEPDSIKIMARRTHLREVTVPVGAEQPTVWMTDMAALAAQYPSVASSLKAAGLTPQQHDAYRAALISASVVKEVNKFAVRLAADTAYRTRWTAPPLPFGSWSTQVPSPITVDPTSALGKNVALLEAHSDQVQALEATGTWLTP